MMIKRKKKKKKKKRTKKKDRILMVMITIIVIIIMKNQRQEQKGAEERESNIRTDFIKTTTVPGISSGVVLCCRDVCPEQCPGLEICSPLRGENIVLSNLFCTTDLFYT